jgi:hypothetical protein
MENTTNYTEILEEKREITTQEALDIILPIPEDQFCVEEFENSRVQRCVLGAVQHAVSGKALRDGNGYGLRKKSREFLLDKHGIPYDISCVNNRNETNGYTEPVIKDRVVHLLNDMIKAGY